MSVNQIKLGGILSYLSLGIGNILVLIYTPFVLRMMGQSEYGLYSLVLSILSYLSLMDFGFGAALVRYISLFKSKKEEERLPSLYGMFISLYTIIGLVCFLLGLGLYFFTEIFFGSSLTTLELEKAKIMILIIVTYLSLNFPFSIFAAIITAHENFVFQKILAIGKSLLTPIFMIPLLLIGYKSIAMACVAVFIGLLITLANIYFCFNKLKIKITFKKFDYPLLIEIFWFSILVFAKMILERIYWSSGQFIIGATIGTIAVAIFSIALQMKGYYESFSQAIGNLFLPRLTSMVANGNSKNLITETFIKVGRIQFHIIGFILCIYILIGDRFIFLWAGKDYISAYSISLFIMIPYTIPLIQTIGNSLIQAYNIQRPLVITFLITTILSIVLSYLFIGRFGIKGCAMALAIAIVVGEVFIMNWFYWKILDINIPVFWREILRIAIVMALITGVFYIFIPLIPINSLFGLVIFVLCFSIIYFPGIFFMAMNLYEKELVLSMIKIFKRK